MALKQCYKTDEMVTAALPHCNSNGGPTKDKLIYNSQILTGTWLLP